MDKLLILIILGIEVEAVWETLKMTWQDGKVSVDRIGALIVGLLIAIGANIEINKLLGIEIIFPYVDTILTGIIISRGSNFIHDLINKINENLQ